uniref:NLR family, CARD domain containing 3-like n=1 Tax=Labrus bergylta TaxID=56723 RepID=A0A3Q3NPM9_9LABR|nr:NACHT, LRR and PYD domains-containing protein 6-like isoform X1 [Labrus bergylta]
MDPDTEVQSFFRQEDDKEDDKEDDEEEKKKWKRPSSSYGSMKSDSDDMEEEDEEEGEYEEVEYKDEVAEACPPPCPLAPPDFPSPQGTGLQIIRSESPETLYTMTTQLTKPPGAVVIETRSSDLEGCSEADDEEEDMDEILVNHSPEPPELVEVDDTMQTDENSQLGRLHPEQDLPHIFKSIQDTVTDLTKEELFKFKMGIYQWQSSTSSITMTHVMEGDILDFVDRLIEILGVDRSLMHTISALESINKKEAAEALRNKCKRALYRYHLKQYLIRKHHVIREGVVRAGKQNLLDTIYVEPQISTCGYGGVDPTHELRLHSPSPLQVPSSDTFVSLNDLFRLQKEGGSPVRTVMTTGIPGIGMSVSVGKFSLDWAEQRANKDLQFVIKLSFRMFWLLRNKNPPPMMSVMEVIENHHPECKDMKYLEEDGCKFLIIMDCFDCYQTSLDWENAPVVNDNNTQTHPDVMIVNIIRGTLLRGARVWILGRRAAVSQIPSKFIDLVTEIQGFSDDMKDDFLKKRFSDPELSAKIVAHYKRLPTLAMLARQPFVCWMVATVFERCFRYQGYGVHPPRLTPFYVSILIVQTNRRLQFYCGKAENELKWFDEDRNMLKKIGKMAFKMLERNTSVFFEEDVQECDLKLMEVTVFSGLCAELPTAASDGRRTYCFIHLTFQEFMAALYVFTMFRTESKNILESAGVHMPKIFASKDQAKSAAALVHCALMRTLNSPLGHYDMFLRFLCGILSPDCHHNQLSRFLYHYNAPKLGGLDEVRQLLEQTIQNVEGNNRDRLENLKECLREMTQEDE